MSVPYSLSAQHHFQAKQSLFLGDLSYFCEESHIATLFEKYGPIVAINICRTNDGEPLYYGFIELAEEESKLLAWKELDGVELLGRNLK
jgi:RNA recognition motif-containing protein